MVSTSQTDSSIADVARGIQQQVDLVCLGAMEMQRETPDPRAIASLLGTLEGVSGAALRAGADPIVQAARIVREAISLAQTETSAPAPYLGHYVTSAAADLARVVNALILGKDPTPILSHAQETILSMPRKGSDYLVEVDITDPAQVARIFAAMGNAPELDELPGQSLETPGGTIGSASSGQSVGRLRELRQLLASYVTRAEALRSSPERRETLNELLIGAKSLRASAAAAGLKPVERLAARLAFVVDANMSSGAVPDQEFIDFTIACGRAMAAAIDEPDVSEPASNRLDQLIQQSSHILRDFRIDTRALGTGMLAAPVFEDAAAGSGAAAVRRALIEALRALSRSGHPDGPDLVPAPLPDAIVADPGRFVDDLAGIAPKLGELITLWEHGAQPAAINGILRPTLLRLKESAAVAGAGSLVDRCWRLEQQLTGRVAAGAGSRAIDDLKTLARDLSWILSQIHPETGERDEAEPSAKIGIPVESAIQVAMRADELMVRSGGYPHRSRRLSNTIQDIAIARDRLGSIQGRLEAGEAALVLSRELAEIISDLSIGTTELDQILAESDALNARSQRVFANLSESVQGLLLVPLDSIAARLDRAAQGMAHRQGKRIVFALEGGSTRVASTALDQLTHALLHLLRNAVEHGIEPPAVRRATGKPAQGLVRVRAHRDGSQVVIDVSDDGAGIDDRQIAARARAVGFPIPADGMPRERALQLIFLPGLTTRTAADGRESGQGLDAVSSAVAEMKGVITVQSELGSGTTFVLRVPVAAAAVEAVIVSVTDQHYALPFTRAEFLPADAVRSISAAGTGFLADLGAARIPAADLGGLLGLRSPQHVQNAGGFWLRVQHEGSQWLIRVDGPPARQDIQLSPINQTLPQLPSVVGSTVLASGETAVALDLAQLLDSRRRARRRRSRQTEALGQAPVALVANASVSARRSLGQALEHAGWRVVEARDGLEAWELLESAAPDLLIIDLDLPVLDAYSVIRAAKTQSDLPVIVLASSQDAHTQAQVMAAGVDVLLTKPAEPEHLLASLSALGQDASRFF